MGTVEACGLAAGPYTMISPITARPCFYYRTVAWEWKQEGRNKRWVEIAAETVHVPFFIDDNSGRVLVDPRGADLDLHCDFKQVFCDSFFSWREPMTPNVRAFLANHGVETRNKIKVEEHCIKPKNSLFILGTLAENPGIDVSPHAIRDSMTATSSSIGAALGSTLLSFSAAAGIGSFGFGPATNDYTSSTPVTPTPQPRAVAAAGTLKSAGMSQQQRIAAALIRAGISNPAAWCAAGLTNGEIPVIADSAISDDGDRGQLTGDILAKHGFNPHPAVALGKGENDQTFMISWRSQRAIARSLGWKCALMIWGGPSIALISLYFLSNS
jgi:hypothetical protein